MDPLSLFLWGVVPYVVITLFIAVHIYRFNTDPYGWTSKSSEIMEKRLLKWGSHLFHWGIILVFFGHVAGLLVPLSFYHSLGVSDRLYHELAVWGGGAAGLMSIVGIAILIYRRCKVKSVRMTSSPGDFIAVILLAVTMLAGLAATGWTGFGHSDFDYRTTISPWIRGILTFRPNPELMADVPLFFKIHVLSALALFAVWPFTRLVHVFSLPLSYLRRGYVLYRRRNPGTFRREG